MNSNTDQNPQRNGRLSKSENIVSIDSHKKSGANLANVSKSDSKLAVSENRPETATHLTSVSQWSDSIHIVLERPPNSLPIKFISGGIAFLSVFVLWACIGQVEEVGQAQGKLIPQGEVLKLQSTDVATVVNIAVYEGQEVYQGQLIAELDSSIAQTEVERLEESISSLSSQLFQHEALIRETYQENVSRMDIANASVRSNEILLLQSQEDITANRELVQMLEDEITFHEQRLDKLRPSLEEGVISREYLFNAEQEYRDKQTSLSRARSEFDRAVSDAQRLESELAQKRSEARRTQSEIQKALQEMEATKVRLQGEIAQDENRLVAARANLSRLTIIAPEDGVVSSLNIQNIGAVTNPGQTIVEIAPEGASLVLQALLPNREAGFVEVGMSAQIKFDAFPYQDFGVLRGRVNSISPDVKPNEQLGPSYEIEISFDSTEFSSRNEDIQLKAGQTASVDIVLRKKRIIDVFLDPFQQLNNGGITL